MSSPSRRAIITIIAIQCLGMAIDNRPAAQPNLTHLFPEGLNVTFEISPSWPIRMAWQAPVEAAYTRLVPSADAVASLQAPQSTR